MLKVDPSGQDLHWLYYVSESATDQDCFKLNSWDT